MRTQPQDIIKKLEADNSRLAKEQILADAMDEVLDEFFLGVRMCLDTLCTFGVKQVPSKEDTPSQGLPWDVFLDLAEKLQRRELTGHAARDAINLAMDVATADQWNNWYRRILIKDLRCGVSEKTVNKVAKAKKLPKYQVPVFSCQLAHDGAKHEKKIAGRKLVETKLDGVRTITIVYPSGGVTMFSRNGKQFSNFTHIEEQFSNIAAMLSEPYVFDGEIMSSSFQDLMKQVRRKKDVAAEDAVLFLFDMIPLADFMNGQCSTSQLDRLKQLHKFYNTENVFTKLENVELLEYADINLDTPAGKTELNEINKRAIDGGYEGIMLKDPLAPYECKRTASWLKIKPFIEVTLTVVAVEEGTGRNEGRLGAFVCKGTDDGCYIEVNCGSGFSDRERQQYWDFRELCVNNLVEIRADAITQNQDGTYSLRFPRFKTFRGFAPGEKI